MVLNSKASSSLRRLQSGGRRPLKRAGGESKTAMNAPTIIGGTGVGGAGDSKIETIAGLAQWRVDNFGPCSYRRSDAFRLGIWNWYISVEKNRVMNVRVFPEPTRVARDQSPVARFIIRISIPGPNRRCVVSPVAEKTLRTCEDFVWSTDFMYHGRFIIDVEFLDLKIANNVGELTSIWPTDGGMQAVASKSALACLSRMLSDNIHTDLVINTGGGVLRAHKAVLSASSPVFESMFLHDLREKESSIVDIEDMSLDACTALLGYIYGNIKHQDFWKHRPALLAAANKYGMPGLKSCCEESLMEDIGTANVLDRLHDAWLYQLHRLKRKCLAYLFDFGKIYDLRDEAAGFFRNADRELVVEMFQEILTVWKPI